MQKKLILFPIALAGALYMGCSEDPTAPTDSGLASLQPLDSQPPISYIDPQTGDTVTATPYLDPQTGDTIPVISYVDPQTGDTVPVVVNPETGEKTPIPTSSAVQPGASSAVVPGSSMAIPGSSAVNPKSSSSKAKSSSSVGLKEYDDNHKPKDSFLPAAGFYKSLTINPPTPQKGGEIRCTFDGSFPNQGSEQITQARQITQNSVVRCSEFVNGKAADTTTQTYFINETVTMPVVALTVNHHDMFDSSAGLYATGDLNQGGQGQWNMGGMMGGGNVTDNSNPKCTEPCEQANFWKDTELPVHVEYFENGSSSQSKTWEIDAGISIIGNWSRYKPKKSVAIKMDDSLYNDNSLKYSFFTTRPEAKRFKSFNLRTNGNRFWTDYIGGAMMTALMEGTDVDYQRSLQVVVFYNGEYFGIHDLRERLNRNFVETNYGIDNKSINMIKIKGTQLEASGTNGASVSEYQQVANQISNGNFAGDNNQSYEQLKDKFNMNSFAQYMLAEMYFHNGDWPENNVRAWGGNGVPFKFVAFDTDHGFGFSPGISGFDAQSQNMFQWTLGSATRDNSQSQQPGQQQPGQGQFPGMGGMGGWGFGGAKQGPAQMLNKLLDNNDFKRLFINNGCILLNDYLTYERVQQTVKDMMAKIPSSEQTRDVQRWPRNQGNFNWAPDGSDLLRFAQNRTQTVRQEMQQYFGLQGEATVSINVSGSGTVLVDGMKLPKSNYSGKFFSGMEMEVTAVPSNGAIFAGWSDGQTQNPRKFQINGQTNITAQFK